MPDRNNQQESTGEQDNQLPPAPTGNASNPSADNGPEENTNQLLGQKAEKYLRESASIEDMPDDQDWQDADEVLKGSDRQGGTSEAP